MLSINRLMKYLRNHHQITVKSNVTVHFLGETVKRGENVSGEV